MSDWPLVRLGEVAGISTGFPFRSEFYTSDSDGIRLLRGDNVGQGHLRWDDAKRWPAATADEHLGYRLRDGDVVLAMDRPWIEAGLKFGHVRRTDLPALLVQRVACLRPMKDIHPGFLRWIIASPGFTAYVLGVQTGTTIPHISGPQVADYSFPLPTIAEQQAIAELLGGLDDKVDVNKRMSGTLDALAVTMFNRALQEAGRGGAAEVSLGEHVEAVRGLSYTGAGLGSGLPLHNLNSIREGGGYKRDGIKYYSGEYKERHLVRPGEIVVANTDLAHKNRIIGYPAIVPARFGEVGLLSHHLYRVRIREGSPLTPSFAYLLLRSEPLRSVVAGYRNGTTVAMLPAEALARPTFTLPSADRIRTLDAQVTPLLAKIEANEDENETLAALRDALLPRLISGDLRVRPSEAVLAATT